MLENVSNTLNKDMREVMDFVVKVSEREYYLGKWMFSLLQELGKRGFVVQWATVIGKNVGVHAWTLNEFTTVSRILNLIR